MKKLDLGIKKYNMGMQNRKSIFNFNDFKGLGYFKDSDKDGVINILDCRPFNKNLQHARPNFMTRKRIKNLPVEVVLESGESVHVLSKRARKEEPEQVKEFLRAMKEQPEALGEIERQQPTKIKLVPEEDRNLGEIFREGIQKDEKTGETNKRTAFIYKHKRRAIPYKEAEQQSIKKLKEAGLPERTAKRIFKKEGYKGDLPTEVQVAMTIRHEMEHAKQYEKEKQLEAKARETKRQAPVTRYKRGWEGNYWLRKREVEARESEGKMIRKRERPTYGARKYATIQFVRTIDQEEPTPTRNQDMGLI